MICCDLCRADVTQEEAMHHLSIDVSSECNRLLRYRPADIQYTIRHHLCRRCRESFVSLVEELLLKLRTE